MVNLCGFVLKEQNFLTVPFKRKKEKQTKAKGEDQNQAHCWSTTAVV